MFLNIKTLILATLTCLSFSAHAQTLSTIEAGRYTLTSGPKELCSAFTLSEKDIKAKTISIGALYSYEILNSSRTVESDIDPACDFREKNIREDHGDSETTLTRINEEYCRGNLRSRTTSVATIRHEEIQIDHEILGAEPYTCIWHK